MQGKVKDIMSSNVVSVLPGQSAAEAARVMEQYNVGSVPVVSGGVRRGILTDRDIVLRCVAAGNDPERTRTADIMTKEVMFLTPSQSARDAVEMMEIEQVRRLPVVENGIVQGVVSAADMVRWFGPEAVGLIDRISGDTTK